MRSMTAASVVDFPLPVGPVTSTRPFLSPAASLRTSGRSKSLNCGGAGGVTPQTVDGGARRHEKVSRERAEPRAPRPKAAQTELATPPAGLQQCGVANL